MTPLLDMAPVRRVRERIAERFGLHVDDGRLGELARLMARGEPEAAGAPEHDGGLERLAAALTVGETYFFRHDDQFRALVERVLPERLAARSGTGLSVLSAGCSTGEEPYTIAMLVREELPGAEIAIRGVDLNPAALARAAAARYAPWSMRATPPDMARRWFTADGREQVLADDIRGAVEFVSANLADPGDPVWHPGTWDVVFCRNVIMYFRPEVQRRVVAAIAAALAEGGYLFLGHAESLRGLSQDFDLVGSHGTFYYRRRRPGRNRHHEAPPEPRRATLPPPVPVPGPPAPDAAWFDAIEAASRRIGRIADEARQRPEVRPGPDAGLELALDLMRRERFVEALDLIDTLPEAARRDPDVLLLQATLLAQGGRFAAAGETCRRLLEADALDAGATYVLGLCFEGLGDREGARLRYEAAAHLDPAFAMPVLRSGLLARQAGDHTAAARDLADAIELLRREDPARLIMFGGGFSRDALIRLCGQPPDGGRPR